MDNCTCTSRERVYIVYGNDFTIEAHVSVYDKDEGIYKLLDLTGVKECQMRLVGTYRKAIGKDITVTGSKVTAFFPGGSVGIGTYGVEITFVDSLGKGRIFERNLIGIVSASGEATVDNDIEGEAGEGLNVSVNVLTRTVRIGDVGSVLADYNLLENRPSIGGVTLEGNKRPSDLGMYSKEEADGKFQTKESAAEADKRVQGMLDGKVDKEPGKGLSANDLTDERAGKVDMLVTDGRANEYLNGAGTYSRPVRQGYGVSVADDNTVSVDPQIIARQSDVANVAADLAAQKNKEQGDIDRTNAAISKEETDRKAAVSALQSLIDNLNPGYQFMGVATPETNPGTPDQKVFYIAITAGTYNHFSSSIILAEGEIAVIKNEGNTWSKEHLTTTKIIEDYSNIIADSWEPNTLFKVGQEILINNIYYRCILEHTSGETFEISDKWVIINDFIIGGSSIQKLNDNPIYQTNIVLTGFGTLGPSAGAYKTGDIYYNTDTHQLRIAITDSPTFASLPFYKGAVYTCNNKLYIWNGVDLIQCTPDIESDIADISEFNNDIIHPERTKLQAYFDFIDPTRIKTITTAEVRLFYFPCFSNKTYTFKTIDGYRLVLGYTKTIPEIGTAVYGTIGGAATAGSTRTVRITTGPEAKFITCFYYSSTGSLYTEQEIFDGFVINGPYLTAVDSVARKSIEDIEDELSHYIYNDDLPINAINYHTQWDNLVNDGLVRRSTATYFSWDTEKLYPIYVYRIQANSDWMNSSYRAEQNLDGTNPLYKRKKIMIISGIHGNERVTPNALYKVIENTIKDANYNGIFGEFDFVIIPLCNPYGYSNTMYNDSDEPIIDNNVVYPIPEGYHIEQNTDSVSIGLRMNISHININRDFSDAGGFVTEEAQFIRDIFIEETPDLCIDFHQDWNDHSGNAVGFVAPGKSSVKTQEEYEEIKRQVYKRIDKVGMKTDSFVNKHLNLTDKQLTYCWQLIPGNTATHYFSGYAQGTSGNTLHQDIAVDYSLILETDVYGYKIGGSDRWNSKVKLYTYELMKNFIQSIVSVFN